MLFDDFVWLMEATWEHDDDTDVMEGNANLREEQLKRRAERIAEDERTEEEKKELLDKDFIQLEKFQKVFDFAVKDIMYVLRNGSPMEVRNMQRQKVYILAELKKNIANIDAIEAMIDTKPEFMIYDERLQEIRKNYAAAEKKLVYEVHNDGSQAADNGKSN